MIQTLENSSSARVQKRQALAALVGVKPNPTPYVLNCTYHGVAIKFYFESESLLTEMKSFLPLNWQNSESFSEKTAMEVFWLKPERFFTSSSWQDDINSDCEIITSAQAESAIQRDFIGMLDVRGFAVVVANQQIDDGFFNAIRWLLPRRMLQFKSVLLHSSCIVGHNSLAYFFLGPSGAGKTTVTQMAGDRMVLGDDMNVLNWGLDGLHAEAGALGQRYSNSSLFSRQFPVGGFFWLRQSPRNFLNPQNNSKSSIRLLSSCANLFWNQSSAELHQTVLSMIEKVVSIQSIPELEFNFDGGFWKYVDSN